MSTVYRFGVRLEGNAAGVVKAAQEAEGALKSLGVRSVSEFRRMAQARDVLGVKGERELQREIQRTEAAYNRLARSGTLGWREQRVAALRMREEVTRLTNEMGRLTTRQKVAMGVRGVAATAAGVGIATAMMAPRVQRSLDFDDRLRVVTNTAYNDRDQAGRLAGYEDLKREIRETVQGSGLGRDAVIGIAEELYGSGRFKPADVRRLMRDISFAGAANAADPGDFAKMAIAANQSMGLTPEQMRKMFGMATFAGQQGGFEVPKMARFLPEQMGLAGSLLGMRGEAGFAKLVALNQAAIGTAGSQDQAGNNVVNLLSKMVSEDTVKDFKKLGIDLRKEYAQGAVRGLDAVDVMGNLLERQFAKDPNLKRTRGALATAAPGSEREAALDSVVRIAQGANIAKAFQDRQALAALLGFLNDRERVRSIASAAPGAGVRAMEENFAFRSAGAAFSVQKAKNEAELATQQSIDKLAPAISSLADKTTELFQKYPGFTTATIAAASALTALAGSAAALALVQGRGAGAAGAARVGALGLALGGAKLVAGAGLAGAAGYGVGTLAYKGLLEGNAGGDLVGRTIARTLSFFGNQDAAEAIRLEDKGARAEQPVRPLRYFSDAGAATVPGAAPVRSVAAGLPTPVVRMPTLNERLGSPGSALQQQLQQDLRGEILVRVSGAPGLNVDAETRSNTPRIPLRADPGRSNLNAGF